MQIELTDEQTTKLAAAIARAQVTAVDDYINAETANWPAGAKAIVLGAGRGTDAQRLQSFYSHRPTIEAEMQQAARVKAANEAQAANVAETFAVECAEFVEKDALRFDRETAQWREQAHAAKAAGRPEPRKPAPAITLEQAPEALNGQRLKRKVRNFI